MSSLTIFIPEVQLIILGNRQKEVGRRRLWTCFRYKLLKFVRVYVSWGNIQRRQEESSLKNQVLIPFLEMAYAISFTSQSEQKLKNYSLSLTHTVSHRGQFESFVCLLLYCIFKYDELMIRDNKTPPKGASEPKIKEEIYKYIWKAYQIKAFFLFSCRHTLKHKWSTENQ